MPSFLAPAATSKRKSTSTDNDLSYKRRALENEVGLPSGGFISGGKEQYWMIQWRNPQAKKHKTWDGDAVLVVRGNMCTMFNTDGHEMFTAKINHELCEGATAHISGKDIEVDRALSREEYFSGSCFGRGASSSLAPTSSASLQPALTKRYVPLKPVLVNSGISALSTATVPKTLGTSDKQVPPEKGGSLYWSATWRKPQAKKHKTFDGDAFVMLANDKLQVVSDKGKIMGMTKWNRTPLFSGYRTFVGAKEIVLVDEVSASRFPRITGAEELDGPASEDHDWEIAVSHVSAFSTPQKTTTVTEVVSSASSAKKFVPPTAFYGSSAPIAKRKSDAPLHDPLAEGAVVMKAPTKEHISRFNKKDMPIVPVVIDPVLVRRLRPHQIEGVKFMYECVMGLRKHEGQGCILADEMGLGKTLQTITLIWTLLKQGPYGGRPTVGKVLIVCPVTLVNNWRNEFRKWLGRDRVNVFTGDQDKNKIKQFVNSHIHQVLVIGYEKLRTIIDDIIYCSPPIGLVVCDEGHRLKSATNKTSKMFEKLRTPRRIILSGTPIQNDLSEFHAMADFCNPGLLDDYSAFKKVYELPILKSRAPGCSTKESELGEARTEQLMTTAKSFVLRREATILKNYLPPKTEYVVFVTPTQLQLSIFSKILRADRLDNLIEGSTAESLAMIQMLTKISGNPILLQATADKARNNGDNQAKNAVLNDAVKLLPDRATPADVSLSGKLTALAHILKAIRRETDEKCIIVSHYTSTLNVIQAFCQKMNYTFERLDGATPTAKRQEYVNSFNKASQASRFLFLLSAKAGGVGLNLIGASRLVLIDSDWNPSHDLQAMARIHRDGQKRPVFIYRFLTTGTIDEKIFQRQVTKLGLSGSLMGAAAGASKSDSFSRKDLRDIFSVHSDTTCHTHDLLECPCEQSGPIDDDAFKSSRETSEGIVDDEAEEIQTGFKAASQFNLAHFDKMEKTYAKKKKTELAALGEWTHINCLNPSSCNAVIDDVLRTILYKPKAEPKPVIAEKVIPKSRVDKLLAAIDLDNLSEPEIVTETLSVLDVPGGTVSFLFERTTESNEEEEGVDDVLDES